MVNLPKSNQKGLGLVEVIAALGISIIVITSLVSLTVFTLRSSQRSKLLLESSKETNRALERIRAKRDLSTWAGDTGSFVDSLEALGCITPTPGNSPILVCSISPTLVMTADSPRDTSTLGIDEVYTRFTVWDPDNEAAVDPDNTDIVRVSVFTSIKFGTQIKTTSLYTDLTSWRDIQ